MTSHDTTTGPNAKTTPGQPLAPGKPLVDKASRLTQIGVDDVAPIARGAAVLGAGGGGDPYVGRLVAEQALAEHGPVRLVSPEDLPDDAVVYPVANMGAPTVGVEKLPTVHQIAEAVRALAAYRGETVTHIACAEAGGINSTVPIVAAAQLGLPLVDGDGMGRAFPELQMILPTLAGVSVTPMAMADEKGNSGIIQAVDNLWAERLGRAITVEMGCSATICNFAMSGSVFRRSCVVGTVSLCHRIGTRSAAARSGHRDAVTAVADAVGGQLVYRGKVLDVTRRTAAGFARGEARLAPLGGPGGAGASGGSDGTGASGGTGESGAQFTLSFQNEHLMATSGERVVVTTPDLIIVLDGETGEPITTEGLRFGQRVAVVAAPADERWHSPGGLELAGPRYFGYDTDPVRWDSSPPFG